MPTQQDFVFPIRVYYEDTDAGGVVFYANYLKFFERARTEWLRHLGVSQHQLAQEQQVVFVVVGTQLTYKKPARLDDALLIRSRITKIGNASIHFEQICERDGDILVKSAIQICTVSTKNFKATPFPHALRLLLPTVQDI